MSNDKLKLAKLANKPAYQTMDIQPMQGGAPQIGVGPSRGRTHSINLKGSAPQEFASNQRVKISANQNQPPPNKNMRRGFTIPAHVGVNTEQMWNSKEVSGIEDPDDDIDVLAYEGMDPLTGADYVDQEQVWQHLDAQASDEQEQFAQPERQESVEDLPTLYVGFLDEQEYCVTIEHSVVFQSKNLDEISSFVEDVMVNHKISIEMINVVQRLGVNFGVKIK